MGIETARSIESQKQRKEGVLLVLAGPTASGKTSVLTELCRQNPSLRRVVSSTTRPKRPDERDGIDYHFLPADHFTSLQETGAFVETTRYGSYLYGTRKNDIAPVMDGQDIAWIVTIGQVLKLSSYFYDQFQKQEADMLFDRMVPVLIGTPSLQTLRTRYIHERKGSRETFLERISDDWGIWKQNGDYFYQVTNEKDKLDQTVLQVSGLMEKRKHVLSLNR